MELTLAEFNGLKDLIYRKTGIHYEKNKIYFLSRRLEKRMIELSMSNPQEYIRYLRFLDNKGLEFQTLINSLTINETYLFRDFSQLQAFAEHALVDIVNRKIETNNNTLRIWSAGCSTGEEPYTLAIILREMLDDSTQWNIHIQASDIDETALNKAKAGSFSLRSMKEVPEEYIDKYFIPDSNNRYKAKSFIKDMISFEQLNLSDKKALRMKKHYDVIFCRNVLIYFDDTSRKKVVDSFYLSLDHGGFIFLGSSESMTRVTTAFKLKRMGKHLVYSKE